MRLLHFSYNGVVGADALTGGAALTLVGNDLVGEQILTDAGRTLLVNDMCHIFVTEIPEDRLLIETDCPYLTPHPYRGRRNDSSYMLLTAEKAAELRGISVERLCSVTLENAARLFPRTGILPPSINEVTAS